MTRTSEQKCGPVLLSLLPFWSPLTPPLGIGVLKGHLQSRGIPVVLEDFNVDPELWSVLPRYVDILRSAVPEVYHGNLFDYAYDVIHNHVMAHVHRSDDVVYEQLIDALVQQNFVAPPPRAAKLRLIECVDDFLRLLEGKVLQAVERHAPAWFGVSTYTTTLGGTLAALRAVRRHFPEVKTVMGGGVFADHVAPGSPNFAAIVNATSPYLDAIVIGEGELALERVLTGPSRADRVYTSADVGRKVVDLGAPAIPDFDGLDLSVYPQMATYVGRSCPFQCSFCSETVQWGKYRTKGSDWVVSELAHLTGQYGGKAFLLADSLINPVADPLFEATSAATLDLYFDAYLRADPEVCDAARVARWRQGGFYRARLGIESGSPDVLAAMNKQTSPPQIGTAIRTLASSGIKTTTYWVVGHPGETEADFQATLRILDECGDDIYEAEPHIFYYFPRGQVSSKKWARDLGIVDLYGERFADMLVARTWTLNQSPTRAETLSRVSRFTTFCRERGIPNPYSLAEIQEADTRWSAGHPGAGPPLAALHNVYHPASGRLPPAPVRRARVALPVV